MSQRYAVIFERAESNWVAYVPDLPGCITTGEIIDETERNIREAIQGHRVHQRPRLMCRDRNWAPINADGRRFLVASSGLLNSIMTGGVAQLVRATVS